MWGARHRKMGGDKEKIMVRSREPRITLEGKPIVKRTPGRPRKRWKDADQSTDPE